jgi:hypothetical protein
MSSEYSDLYLIANIQGYYECISCRLQEQISIPAWEFDGEDVVQILGKYFKCYPSYIMHNIKSVYRHIRHHLYAHHKVPIETIQRVVAEYYGIHVSRLQELWTRESWEFDENNL